MAKTAFDYQPDEARHPRIERSFGKIVAQDNVVFDYTGPDLILLRDSTVAGTLVQSPWQNIFYDTGVAGGVESVALSRLLFDNANSASASSTFNMVYVGAWDEPDFFSVPARSRRTVLAAVKGIGRIKPEPFVDD